MRTAAADSRTCALDHRRREPSQMRALPRESEEAPDMQASRMLQKDQLGVVAAQNGNCHLRSPAAAPELRRITSAACHVQAGLEPDGRAARYRRAPC
jgi:hypothetical protein